MAAKELKQMSRTELLQLLIERTQQVDDLTKELEETKQLLTQAQAEHSPASFMRDTGAIANAAHRINDVFTSAQDAAKLYLDNIEQLHREQVHICQHLVEDSYQKAEQLLSDARRRCDVMESEARKRCAGLYTSMQHKSTSAASSDEFKKKDW